MVFGVLPWAAVVFRSLSTHPSLVDLLGMVSFYESCSLPPGGFPAVPQVERDPYLLLRTPYTLHFLLSDNMPLTLAQLPSPYAVCLERKTNDFSGAVT